MHAIEYLFIMALVLYTLVIWTHRFRGQLKPWMVVVFALALSADTAGTWFLCAPAAAAWVWTVHTVTGLASLVIMAIHFFWVVSAITVRGKWESVFHRFSVWAWALWLISFVSGIPLW